jgi:hypothetical protein
LKIRFNVLKITVLLVFVICIGVTFNGYTFGEKTAMASNINNSKKSDAIEEQAHKKDNIDDQKVIDSYEEYRDTNFPLIAAIPEKNIYLYAIKSLGYKGVVLYVNGVGHYYDWTYMTPRFILPRLNVADFDNDGDEELAAILYVGSGTGVAVEELHIVNIYENDILSNNPKDINYLKPNPEYFADYLYESKDYMDTLNKQVKIKSYKEEKELKASVIVNDQITNVSLKELQYIDNAQSDIKVGERACLENIVHFNVNNNKITAKFDLGICCNLMVTPIYSGAVYGDVYYKDNEFTLNNLKFKVDKY